MDDYVVRDVLERANEGYRIFPCAPGAKQPLIKAWPEKATDDLDTIRDWWATWPNANVGLPTGPDNDLLVLDIDVKAAADGFASLAELEAQFSKLPDTVRVDTPTGGAYLYFRYPKEVSVGNKAGFRPGLDIRGAGRRRL